MPNSNKLTSSIDATETMNHLSERGIGAIAIASPSMLGYAIASAPNQIKTFCLLQFIFVCFEDN